MRILKCYLANNTRNQFVNAKEAAKASDDAGYWTCANCGSKLILQKGGMGEVPWFEHIPHSVSHQQLMKCAWVDPEEKARAREKKLRQVVYSVDRNIRPPQEWYCAISHIRGISTAESVNQGSIARS